MLDRKVLIEFLKQVDKELIRNIILVAVGGTALTLLNAKSSTRDIDFTIPSKHYEYFQRALKETAHGFTVDYWPDGTVYSQTLPDDYLRRSRKIRKMKHIRLKALHPVDIVVTKIGRLDKRDKQDIQTCIRKFKLAKTQVAKRAKMVEYVGRPENYGINLHYVLRNFFK
jgi:hypothetical protein